MAAVSVPGWRRSFNGITIANSYSITAKDGDVEALNTKADGYSTSVSDGDNRLFNQSNDNGGTLTQNDAAPIACRSLLPMVT